MALLQVHSAFKNLVSAMLPVHVVVVVPFGPGSETMGPVPAQKPAAPALPPDLPDDPALPGVAEPPALPGVAEPPPLPTAEPPPDAVPPSPPLPVSPPQPLPQADEPILRLHAKS